MINSGWANLSGEDWSSLSLDDWSTLPLDGTARSQRPVMVVKGGDRDTFLDCPILDAAPSGAYTSQSVLLDRGAFVFRANLLEVPSLGALSWKFGLNYQHQFAYDDSDRITRIGFPNECAPYIGSDRRVDVDAVIEGVGDGADAGGTYSSTYESFSPGITDSFDPSTAANTS